MVIALQYMSRGVYKLPAQFEGADYTIYLKSGDDALPGARLLIPGADYRVDSNTVIIDRIVRNQGNKMDASCR